MRFPPMTVTSCLAIAGIFTSLADNDDIGVCQYALRVMLSESVSMSSMSSILPPTFAVYVFFGFFFAGGFS